MLAMSLVGLDVESENGSSLAMINGVSRTPGAPMIGSESDSVSERPGKQTHSFNSPRLGIRITGVFTPIRFHDLSRMSVQPQTFQTICRHTSTATTYVARVIQTESTQQPRCRRRSANHTYMQHNVGVSDVPPSRSWAQHAGSALHQNFFL